MLGRRLVVGRGVAWSEEPVFRMRAGHAGQQRRSCLSSRPGSSTGAVGVDEELSVDGVADLALERS
jgi:hypothetical protein